MARCKFCGKGGWLSRTDSEGLCDLCSRDLSVELDSAVRVVEESLRIVSRSKSLPTILQRLGVAEDACKDLLRYEALGITSTTPPPSEFIEAIDGDRQAAIRNWLGKERAAARTKVEAATTPAAKTRGYTKLLELIGDLYPVVDDMAYLQATELAVRQELDSVLLALAIERADRLAFRGQKKRACDAYLDALFMLRGDSVPDADQAPTVARIEARILELGGEVPPSTTLS